ncbi:unnamed protein product, partial [Symbiodinium natans]
SVVNRLDSSRSGDIKDGHYPHGIPREDLRALFAEADADRSGEVSAMEWSTMLYRLEVSTWPTPDAVNVPRAVMTINSAAAKWGTLERDTEHDPSPGARSWVEQEEDLGL